LSFYPWYNLNNINKKYLNKKYMEQNKELILDELREAMVKEELAIPLYVSHIQQTLFWSGLPADKQEKIIASLKVLDTDSEKHAQAFKHLVELYKKL
jgi:hypothetical protein